MSTAAPPGKKGLPLVGKTLNFVNNPFGLIEEGYREYGPIFQTSILGEDTVFLVGPEACEIWVNFDLIERQKSLPPHIKNIFGNEDVLPMIDGDHHSNRKELIMAGFSRPALEGYLPGLQETLQASLSQLANSKQIDGVSELKKLALRTIANNMIGLTPGERLDHLIDLYMATDGAMTCIPVPLPGTVYSRMLKAVKQIFIELAEIGAERQANPGIDAYSRILTAQLASGKTISIDEAKFELHHCILGGYIIWGTLAHIIQVLYQKKELRELLLNEVEEKCSTKALSLKQLIDTPQLLKFIMEIKRITPIVPGQFARAKADFEFNGFKVKKGTRLFLGMHMTDQAESTYTSPQVFDPERFAPERAEDKKHEHAFIPQGPGTELTHRCPGLDYATYFMQVFTILLLKGFTWDIPSQNLDYNWKTVPPEPADGFQFLLHPRAT